MGTGWNGQDSVTTQKQDTQPEQQVVGRPDGLSLLRTVEGGKATVQTTSKMGHPPASATDLQHVRESGG